MGKTIGERKKRKLRAKAVKVSEEEYQKEISGKFRDFIHAQYDYQECYLLRREKEERLSGFKKAITEAKKQDKDMVDYIDMKFPLDLAKVSFNRDLFYLRVALRNEKEARKKLIKVYGLKDKDLIGILEYKYIKSLDNFKDEDMNYVG